jgi:phage shock protein PspC (stress-responsive transcriptional regulator)
MTTETATGPITQAAGPDPAALPVPLHRSTTDRVLAGVCGGFAETYGADATAVRILTAILTLFTGILPMVLVYLLAAVLLPEGSAPRAADGPVVRRRIEPGQGALIVGLVLIVGGVAALANEVLRIDWDVLWPIGVIAFGGVLVLAAWRRPSSAAPVAAPIDVPGDVPAAAPEV